MLALVAVLTQISGNPPLQHAMFALPAPSSIAGKLRRNGSQLLLNGNPFSGIGLNVVDAMWNNNLQGIEDAAKRGFPFVRFAAMPYFVDDLRAWQRDSESWWATGMDRVVAAAHRFGIRLVPDLLWNPFAIADLCNEPLSALFNGTNSCSRQRAREFVAQASSRYANNSAILFWELSNENNALVDGYLANSTVACDAAHGTPSHRSDADNFDSAQMIATHSWLATIIKRSDPGTLVNTGQSMPRPFAQRWRDNPRAEVAKHHMDSRLDNESAFVKNLLDTNAPPLDFVSAHMGGVSDNVHRAFAANESSPTWLLELARTAAAKHGQPFYLGEFTVTISKSAEEDGPHERSYGYAEAVVDWVLDVHRRGDTVLASAWVFEYANQNATFSLISGRDEVLLQKMQAANAALRQPLAVAHRAVGGSNAVGSSRR
jgi:hypothetical protein